MISWDTFKQAVHSVMTQLNNPATYQGMDEERRKDYAFEQLSTVIATQYDLAVRAGKDTITQNMPLLTNVAALKSAIKAALPIGYVNPTSLPIGIQNGVLAYWTGATLNSIYTGSPPGYISMAPLSNVLVPGAIVVMLPPPAESQPTAEQFVNMLVGAFTAHTATLSGIHAVMIPPYPAPPHPLPWMGII